jgi:aminoglycoside phosphotransferase (APT) family kinase protein
MAFGRGLGSRSEEPLADDSADLAQRLDALVRARLGGERALGLARVSAGATQEIWRFAMAADGAEIPLILRRAPGGTRVSESAVGLETEAALIEAAATRGVPVPPVRHVLEPEDGLGRGFIMGFVNGETLGGRIARGEAFAATRDFLARQCGEILARLHTMDPDEFPNLRRASPAELLAQYRDIYRTTAWPRPVFELALRWLADHCPPPPDQPRLVHGDFRNGNLMVGGEGVRAVLDWEIAHVADPMEDLGWICVGSWRFGVDDKPVGGFGLREDLWAGYEAAGGAPVRREHARWWEVFGSLRWGVMCSGMAGTFRTVDPNVERAVIARRASETEVDLMRLLAT